MYYRNILNKINPYRRSAPGSHQLKPGPRRSISLVILATAVLIGLVTLLQPADDAAAVRHEPTIQTLQLPAANITAEPIDVHVASTELPWQEVTVRSGDTLSSLFHHLKLSAGELHAMMQANASQTATLRQLRPGQILRFQIDESKKQLQVLHYHIDQLTTLLVERNGNDFTTRQITRSVDKHLAYSSATITSSFFVAGQQAGLSDSLIMDLADIFGWDIDFALDIRQNDSFTVLYEQAYLDGEPLTDTNILAAEFINQGRKYQAVRHVDNEGNVSFYSPEGLSMRKAFLRSPVDFKRISSGFRPERYHPVLGVKRPHRGVDYAAPTGTPIKASGDGRIDFIGTKSGYGKTIILQHGGAYRTLYAHMSRFNPKVRTGSRVKQGQIIGYVGQTGLATGPHLHYEFLVNGVHRNPLTVKLPTAEPIDNKYRVQFQQQAQVRLAQLEAVKQTTLAMDNH